MSDEFKDPGLSAMISSTERDHDVSFWIHELEGHPYGVSLCLPWYGVDATFTAAQARVFVTTMTAMLDAQDRDK